MKFIVFIILSGMVSFLMIYDPLFGWMTLAFLLFFALIFREFRSVRRDAKMVSKDEACTDTDESTIK